MATDESSLWLGFLGLMIPPFGVSGTGEWFLALAAPGVPTRTDAFDTTLPRRPVRKEEKFSRKLSYLVTEMNRIIRVLELLALVIRLLTLEPTLR